MKTIDLIAGARPNFMKIAPTIDALKAAQTRGCRLHDSPLPQAGEGGRRPGEGKLEGFPPKTCSHGSESVQVVAAEGSSPNRRVETMSLYCSGTMSRILDVTHTIRYAE
jgi:hypothetical protein